MTKKKWETEAKKVLSEILQSADTRDALIQNLSLHILNYFNHRDDIAYGLMLDLMTDQNSPFSASALLAYNDQFENLEMYLAEEKNVFMWDFRDVLVSVFSKWLTANWPEIIKARLLVESSFSHAGDFVALRRFLVIAKNVGIQFYTKDSDGGGPDIIEGAVVTDLVHSDYESIASIEEIISSRPLADVIKGSRDGVSFANRNYDIVECSKKELEFFGPGDNSPFYRFIKTRKEAFSEALARLAEEVSLPLTLDLKFVPRGDRMVFNIKWERKLPEFFYKISNHNSDNRFY